MTITKVTTALAALTGSASDATFRIWGKAWTDTMDALGLTQVYSNIDWATVAVPTTGGAFAGKRVYSINDALSSTREIYICLEFGRGNTGTGSAYTRAAAFAIRVTVGRAHSAGTVSTDSFTNYVCMGSTTAAGEIIGYKTDAGIIVMSNADFEAYQNSCITVERVCDANGPTVDGVIVTLVGAAIDTASQGGSTTTCSGLHCRAANFSTGQVYSGAAIVGTPTAFSWSGSGGATNPLHNNKIPVFQTLTWGDYQPMYQVVNAPVAVGPGKQFPATINGVTATYRTLANVPTHSSYVTGYRVA